MPSGGNTTDRILSMSLYFKILSFTVVDVRDGEAFTWKPINSLKINGRLDRAD